MNVVEQEVYLNCKPQTFLPLLFIFGLCSVLGKNIQTVYPEEEGRSDIYLKTNKEYHNLCKDIKFSQDEIIVRPSKKKCLFAKIRVAKKKSTRQAGNLFFFLIFRLYLQTKFSKEQKK